MWWFLKGSPDQDICRCLLWGLEQYYPVSHPQTHLPRQTNRPVHSHKGASPATATALHALLSRELRVPE